MRMGWAHWEARLFVAAGAVAALIAMSLATAAIAAPAAQFDFAISAGPLDAALRRYMAVTGRQLLYRSTLIAGKSAPAISGSMSATLALDTLLAHSGIEVRHPAANVWILVAAPAQARPRATGRIQPPAGRPQPPARAPKPVAAPADPDTPGQEVVVTGTNIRGSAIGPSPLLIVRAQDIERGGFGSVAEALGSLPQNFGGTGNEDTTLTGSDRTIRNRGLGSSVNLRGLGSDATLTLINGRRAAGSGGKGDFTDLSVIPTAAVERIEVLADGASALYGSDAVGGVVNVILRQTLDGGESRIRLGSATRRGPRDIQASQLLGTRWRGGHALLAYEFQRREALPIDARRFTASADLRAWGGSDYRSYFSSPGTILVLDPATRSFVPGFAIPDGQNGIRLTPAALARGANLSNPRAGADTLPEQTRHSLYATGEQRIGAGITLYAEARYAHRRFAYRGAASTATIIVAPNNPYFVSPDGSATTRIAYSFERDLGPTRNSGTVEAYSWTGGARIDAFGDWQVDGFVSRARETDDTRNDGLINSTALAEAVGTTADTPATAFSTARDGFFNPFGTGSSNARTILDFVNAGYSREDDRHGLLLLNAKADGSLVSLPGGAVKLAIGAQHRREDFSREAVSFVSGVAPTTLAPTKASRGIDSGFAELSIPVFGERNRRAALERLVVSLAIRHERYSDFGTTTDPKFGAIWEPLPGLLLRGSYGTSFRAPAIPEVRDPFRIAYTNLPSAGGASLPVLFLVGGNTDLKPERATSYTLGARLAPPAWRGFSAELTYFSTRFTDRIAQPALEQITQALSNPIYSPFVQAINAATSASDLATVRALLANPGSTVPATLTPDFFRFIVDGRFVNASRVDVRGLDATLRATRTAGRTTVAISANASLLIDYQDQLTTASPIVERVGTVGNPADFRARITADATRGDLGATMSLNYTGRYTDNVSIPSRGIADWAGVDLQLRYQPRAPDGWKRGLSASLSVQNVFDAAPPFVNRAAGLGFDAANADPLGRVVALQLKKSW